MPDNPSPAQPSIQPVTNPAAPQPTPITNQPPPPPLKPHRKSKLPVFGIALLAFILGIIGGILLFALYPKTNNEQTIPPTTSSGDITLPKDTAKIQDCADNKGALYAKPQDIPQGPVYMFYNNKVIGLEYEINQDDFTKGKIYKDLKALNIHIDHLNAGFLPNGHAGLPNPHSHIDLYLVDAKTEQSIVCPTPAESMITPTASESALTITPEATQSSQLSPKPSSKPSLSPTQTLIIKPTLTYTPASSSATQ